MENHSRCIPKMHSGKWIIDLWYIRISKSTIKKPQFIFQIFLYDMFIAYIHRGIFCAKTLRPGDHVLILQVKGSVARVFQRPCYSTCSKSRKLEKSYFLVVSLSFEGTQIMSCFSSSCTRSLTPLNCSNTAQLHYKGTYQYFDCDSNEEENIYSSFTNFAESFSANSSKTTKHTVIQFCTM